MYVYYKINLDVLNIFLLLCTIIKYRGYFSKTKHLHY